MRAPSCHAAKQEHDHWATVPPCLSDGDSVVSSRRQTAPLTGRHASSCWYGCATNGLRSEWPRGMSTDTPSGSGGELHLHKPTGRRFCATCCRKFLWSLHVLHVTYWQGGMSKSRLSTSHRRKHTRALVLCSDTVAPLAWLSINLPWTFLRQDHLSTLICSVPAYETHRRCLPFGMTFKVGWPSSATSTALNGSAPPWSSTQRWRCNAECLPFTCTWCLTPATRQQCGHLSRKPESCHFFFHSQCQSFFFAAQCEDAPSPYFSVLFQVWFWWLTEPDRL